MFTCTLRRPGLQRLAAAAVCTAILAGAVIGTAAAKRETAVETAGFGENRMQITGAQDAAAFLQGYGLEADLTTAEVNTVTVPRRWDDDFRAFNEVIRQSGLDLSRMKNKKADKWVLLIPARTTEAEKCYGVVLVYKKQPRGAYLLKKPSGEVLPLTAEAPTGLSLALTDEEIAANAGFNSAQP